MRSSRACRAARSPTAARVPARCIQLHAGGIDAPAGKHSCAVCQLACFMHAHWLGTTPAVWIMCVGHSRLAGRLCCTLLPTAYVFFGSARVGTEQPS